MNSELEDGRGLRQPALLASLPEPASGLVPSGDEPARNRFVGWIADKLQLAHVPHLPRESALSLARGCLEQSEIDDGPFGHPDFRWDESGAHELAQSYEIDHWETAGGS